MSDKLDRRSIAAWLLGGPEELGSFKEYGDHVVVLNQAGQKFTFDDHQIELAATAMEFERSYLAEHELKKKTPAEVEEEIHGMARLVKKPPERKPRKQAKTTK
jgi:hypothetical protein